MNIYSISFKFVSFTMLMTQVYVCLGKFEKMQKE